MAKKDAYPAPSKEQTELMKRNGIKWPLEWVIMKDFQSCIMVRHRFSGEVKLIEKK